MTLQPFLVPTPYSFRNPDGTPATCSLCRRPGEPDLHYCQVHVLPEPWRDEYFLIYRFHWRCWSGDAVRQARAHGREVVQRLRADAARRTS